MPAYTIIRVTTTEIYVNASSPEQAEEIVLGWADDDGRSSEEILSDICTVTLADDTEVLHTFEIDS